MTIRTVHLVRCDRCSESEHLPLHCWSQAQARADAKYNGWTRVRTSPGPGTAYYDDVCPACTAKTKGGAL